MNLDGLPVVRWGAVRNHVGLATVVVVAAFAAAGLVAASARAEVAPTSRSVDRHGPVAAPAQGRVADTSVLATPEAGQAGADVSPSVDRSSSPAEASSSGPSASTASTPNPGLTPVAPASVAISSSEAPAATTPAWSGVAVAKEGPVASGTTVDVASLPRPATEAGVARQTVPSAGLVRNPPPTSGAPAATPAAKPAGVSTAGSHELFGNYGPAEPPQL